ncbi:hypothetical protein Tco_1474434 [Tanacetum coccineum]
MSNRRKEKLKFNLKLNITQMKIGFVLEQRLKLNAELSKSILGKLDLQGEDFAKKIAEDIYDELLEESGTWKLSQLKNLSFGSGLRTQLINLDKDDSEGSDEVSEQDDSVTGISRDDLTELYRIVNGIVMG